MENILRLANKKSKSVGKYTVGYCLLRINRELFDFDKIVSINFFFTWHLKLHSIAHKHFRLHVTILFFFFFFYHVSRLFSNYFPRDHVPRVFEKLSPREKSIKKRKSKKESRAVQSKKKKKIEKINENFQGLRKLKRSRRREQ